MPFGFFHLQRPCKKPADYETAIPLLPKRKIHRLHYIKATRGYAQHGGRGQTQPMRSIVQPSQLGIGWVIRQAE